MATGLNLYLKINIRIFNHYWFKPNNFSKNKSNLRLYATGIVTKKAEIEGPIYKKTDHEYKISRKATVQTIEELLNLKTFDAFDIVVNNKFFQHVSTHILKENYKLFKQERISLQVLAKYPELLTIADSKEKIKLIKKLLYDINTVIYLIVLQSIKLKLFVMSELTLPKNSGKIATLSSLLQISPQKACEYIVNKPFLMSMSSDKLKKNIKILLDYGISCENICKDLWVLKYSQKVIKNRLDMVKENKIDILKTWMVRAQEKTFQNHIQRRSDTKSILGDNSLVEYLSERLECSEDFANYIILKQPALKNRSMKKLKEFIDFLYAEGFKSHQICRVPKILLHSLETTRKRLKLLQDKNIQIDGLSLLTKSQNQFMQYYEALIKNKNKTKTKS